jgi:hypothetical protein
MDLRLTTLKVVSFYLLQCLDTESMQKDFLCNSCV